MKNINKFFFVGIAALCLAGFTSCSDKEEAYDFDGYSYDRVFLANSTTVSAGELVSTPIGYLPAFEMAVNARLTSNAKSDIKVNVKVDPTLVDAYNAENEKAYAAIPADAVQFSANELTIEKGKSISEDVLMTISEAAYTQLTEPEYLIPVVITSASDASIKVNADYSTRYYVLNVKEKWARDMATEADMPAPKITDYTGWTLVGGNVPSLTAANQTTLLTGGSSGTSTYNWTWNSQETYAIFDMGKTYNIGGCAIKTNYSNYGGSYLVNNLGMELSMDNQTWTDCGYLPRGTFAYDSWGLQFVGLYATMPARYIKIKARLASSSSSYRRVQALRVYGEVAE